MDSLAVMPISQAQARQRSGRAGRTDQENAIACTQKPLIEIRCCWIQSLISSGQILPLRSCSWKLWDLMIFLAFISWIRLLHRRCWVLWNLCMHYRLSMMKGFWRRLEGIWLISPWTHCEDGDCFFWIRLFKGNPFHRCHAFGPICILPAEGQAKQADSKKAKFQQPEGDLLTVYNWWKAANFSNPWCYENFIQATSMRQAQDMRKKLLGIMDRYVAHIIKVIVI